MQNHEHLRFGRMTCMLLQNLVACYLNLPLWTWGYVKNKHCRKIKFTCKVFLVVGLCYFWIDVANTSALAFILGAFAKLRKRLLASSCLSVRMEQLLSPQSELSWNLIFVYFSKIQVSIKSDKNNGYLTWWQIYIYISLNSSWNEKRFRQKLLIK
jgi:hypothetical protein